jgi:hypothetical protein
MAAIHRDASVDLLINDPGEADRRITETPGRSSPGSLRQDSHQARHRNRRA